MEHVIALIVDGAVDQVCETVALARGETRDLREMGYSVRQYKGTWHQVTRLEDCLSMGMTMRNAVAEANRA